MDVQDKALRVFADDYFTTKGIRANRIESYRPDLPGVVWNFILMSLEQRAEQSQQFGEIVKLTAAATALRQSLTEEGF